MIRVMGVDTHSWSRTGSTPFHWRMETARGQGESPLSNSFSTPHRLSRVRRLKLMDSSPYNQRFLTLHIFSCLQKQVKMGSTYVFHQGGQRAKMLAQWRSRKRLGFLSYARSTATVGTEDADYSSIMLFEHITLLFFALLYFFFAKVRHVPNSFCLICIRNCTLIESWNLKALNPRVSLQKIHQQLFWQCVVEYCFWYRSSSSTSACDIYIYRWLLRSILQFPFGFQC